MNKKAQNFSEYALVIGVVTIALFAMQVYFKRGIQGIIRVTASDLGSPAQAVYYDDTGENVSSQFLGVREKGVWNFTQIAPSTNKVEQKIVTNETPRGAREKFIEKDQTVTQGSSSTIYKAANIDDFGSKKNIGTP
jgi:hypothetical protein